MKIIDNSANREKIANILEGEVFRFNGEYYLKTKTMFLYEEMQEFSDGTGVLNMEELENNASAINAINLLTGRCYDFHNDLVVETLEVELHIM